MGRGGGGGSGSQTYVTRNGRPDVSSGKKKAEEGQPDFGANANMIPLGGKGGKQRGGRQANQKSTPHFYSNPMSMSLDEELGSSAMRMKRAAR